MPKVIGLFIHMENYVTWPLIDGVIEAARQHDVRVITHTVPIGDLYWNISGADVERIYPRLQSHLDGVVFGFPGLNLQQYAAQLWARGVPVCLVARRYGDLPYALCANAEPIRDLVLSLARRGHTRIAYIEGWKDNLSAVERHRGYLAGLAAAGLPYDPDLIIPSEFKEEMAHTNVHALLQRGIRFTALVASNDLSALGALAALHEFGLRVPDDVELTGFDNISRSRWSSPPLSTFDFPLFQMAFLATQAVVQGIRQQPYEREIVVPATYIPRSSTRATATTTTATDPVRETNYKDFIHAVQLERLQGEATAAGLLQRLTKAPAESPEYSAVFEALLAETSRLRMDPECLLPLLEAHSSNTAATAAHERARRLVAANALDEQSHRAESADLFHSATRAVTELVFNTAEEAAVIELLKRTLRNFNVDQAGLYTAPETETDPAGTPAAGMWYWWSPTLPGGEIREAKQDLAAIDPALFLTGANANWLLAPLFYGQQLFGLMVLDMNSEYLVYYADLVRHFATALHAARIYRALAQANGALKDSEYFYHSLVESLPQIIIRKDSAGRITYANAVYAELLERPLSEIIGREESAFYPPDYAERFRQHDRQVAASRQPMEFEYVVERPGRPRRFLHGKKVPLSAADGQLIGVQSLFWDITSFRETENQLKQTQQELVETSRLAGIAEISTGILHNLGNVLNSVNTSAGLTATRLRQLRLAGLEKMVEILPPDPAKLGEFVTTDQRGQRLPAFLAQLAGHLRTEQAGISDEIKSLRQHIDHMNEIVAAQQGFARVETVLENLSAADLVEHALRISETTLHRHSITVVREFLPVPPIRAERHKVLQILVNLIRNAKESVKLTDSLEKRIVLIVRPTPGPRVQIAVTDNGAGVAPENLVRLFTFGFTTKADGHGFGLHSSALVAHEIGATLVAHSQGENQGATFVLDLPA